MEHNDNLCCSICELRVQDWTERLSLQMNLPDKLFSKTYATNNGITSEATVYSRFQTFALYKRESLCIVE